MTVRPDAPKAQVRTWTAWHRWVTLAMLALAFLTIAAAAEREPHPAVDDHVIPQACAHVIPQVLAYACFT